jgi:hypothetical protein
MDRLWIFIIIIIILLIIISRKLESYTSDEAIQNLTSMYNNQILTATKLRITDEASIRKNLDVSGSIKIGSSTIVSQKLTPTVNSILISSPNGNYTLSIQDDGNLVMYDRNLKVVWASRNASVISPNGDYHLQLSDAGTLYINDPDNTKTYWMQDNFTSTHTLTVDEWAFDKWADKIKYNKYFNKSMPDYTTKMFCIILKGEANVASTILLAYKLNSTKVRVQWPFGGRPGMYNDIDIID